MSRKYAILRVAKIKDWSAFGLLVDHCERMGKVLPANVDKNRQKLNRRLFPQAPGPQAAKDRWQERVGNQTVRRNAVLALEVFMGFSDDKTFDEQGLRDWKARNLRWLRKTFGRRNVIAGASNEDEKTPHLHAMVIPLDKRGKLNCRKILGDRGNMQDLQSSYGEAMAFCGLNRGVMGSKRKHVPQRRLYEFRMEINREVKKVEDSFASQLDRLAQFGLKDWNVSRKAIIGEVEKTMAEAKQTLADMAELGKEVLLARRDAQEREQIFRENGEAKERADTATKELAAMVRGLDLVPIATEILALTPTEKDGIFTFADDQVSLVINGRKFEDAKNPKCKGAGAIDLVAKLTGRNFKEAVEFLVPRHSPAALVADAAGVVFEETKAKVEPIKPAQPRVLTIHEVPAKIWQPVPDAWKKLRRKLVEKHQFDGRMLQNFWEREMLWAVSDSVLAVARPDLEDESKKPALRGVTLLDIDSPALVPRVLAPEQGGVFWVGNSLSKTDTIVGVANPLEALAYREIMLMDRKQKSLSDPAQPLPPAPMIVSLDAEFPTIAMFERIKQARKKSEEFVLATNTPLRNNELAEKAPLLYGPNGKFLDWVTLNILGDYAVENSLTNHPPQLAWTRLMVEKIQARERDQEQKKQY